MTAGDQIGGLASLNNLTGVFISENTAKGSHQHEEVNPCLTIHQLQYYSVRTPNEPLISASLDVSDIAIFTPRYAI